MATAKTQTEGTFLANAGWLLLDYGVRLGVGLLVWIVIARHFGPKLTGAYNYAVALVACATPLITLGLDAVIVHSLSTDPAQRSRVLGTATTLRIGASIVGFVCLLVVGFLVRTDDDQTKFLIALVALQLVFQIGDIADFEFQSRLNGAAIVKARVSAFLVSSAARLVTVSVFGSMILLAAITPVEAILVSALLFIAHHKQFGDMRSWRWDRVVARQLLDSAWPLAVSGFLLAGIAHADKLVLGQLSGSNEVGIYSAAYQLSGAWYAIATIVTASTAPGLARVYGTSQARYAAQVTRIQTGLTAIAVVIAICMTLCSKAIIELLFGPAFSASASVLVIHIWTGVFVSHVHFRSRLFVIEGKQRFVAAYAALALVTNIILNCLLDPVLGARGAAYASLGSWVTCTLIYPQLARQSRGAATLLFKSLNPISWVALTRGSSAFD